MGRRVTRVGSLFPLPLTAFEKFMMALDTSRYPATFRIDCELAGELDPALAAESLLRTLERHPMLQVLCYRDCWCLSPSAVMPLVRQGSSPKPLDLRHEGGFRLHFSPSSLGFEFHHAVCDGEGAALVIRDFFHFYQRGNEHRVDRLPPFDAELLRHRHRIPQVRVPGPHLSLLQRLKFALSFLFTLPMQVTGDQNLAAAEPRRHTTYVFSSEQTQRIRAQVRAQGCNLNSLGLALLFRTLHLWQTRRSAHFARRPVRILVPTSLRSKSDYQGTACNRISFAFLARQPHVIEQGLEALAGGLDEEMRFIRSFRPDLTTLKGIALADTLKFAKFVPYLPMVQSTAILTHVTAPTLAGSGDFALKSVCGAPPPNRGTRVAFCLSRSRSCQTITLRCDPCTFSAEAERDLLNAYVAAWMEWSNSR